MGRAKGVMLSQRNIAANLHGHAVDDRAAPGGPVPLGAADPPHLRVHVRLARCLLYCGALDRTSATAALKTVRRGPAGGRSATILARRCRCCYEKMYKRIMAARPSSNGRARPAAQGAARPATRCGEAIGIDGAAPEDCSSRSHEAFGRDAADLHRRRRGRAGPHVARGLARPRDSPSCRATG
ncbi:MAG: hypothetical protein MZV64_25185 [Ignavibacteriales bacterium]|nr:hypothetical protein [Ignavibacteriales bacterium]